MQDTQWRFPVSELKAELPAFQRAWVTWKPRRFRPVAAGKDEGMFRSAKFSSTFNSPGRFAKKRGGSARHLE
jgi:hypothetical protein